jgi:hypothetical protein
MDSEERAFNVEELESINQKAIQNQFFTPDNVYLELGLFKDIPIGTLYADSSSYSDPEAAFKRHQAHIQACVKDYQVRRFDTVDELFSPIGYTDDRLDQIRAGMVDHDKVFIFAPTTKFFEMLIRHTIRNQNNSRPAAKYSKKKLDGDSYIMDAIPVTYYINTFPLTLSSKILAPLGSELGESLGVNIVFLNHDPRTFGQEEWDSWLSKIDCFYFDSLGRFLNGEFVLAKQGNLEFTGRYFFARKQFEKRVMPAMRSLDFDQQIQLITSRIDMLCDFAWIQNNDVRLTEEALHVPVEEPDIPAI